MLVNVNDERGVVKRILVNSSSFNKQAKQRVLGKPQKNNILPKKKNINIQWTEPKRGYIYTHRLNKIINQTRVEDKQ